MKTVTISFPRIAMIVGLLLALSVLSLPDGVEKKLSLPGWYNLHAQPRKGMKGKVYPSGNTSPLCRAVLTGNIGGLASFPAGEFSRVQARTGEGIPCTVLHLAVELGDMKLIRAISERKINWNSPDLFKVTPLTLAVLKNRRDIVEHLIAHGADPNAASTTGTSAYCHAPRFDPSILDALIASGIKPDNINPIVNAIASGNPDAVKKLYPLSRALIKDPDALISIAARFGYADITKYLAGKFNKSADETGKLMAIVEGNNARYRDFISRSVGRLHVDRIRDEHSGREGTYSVTMKEFSPWTMEEPDAYLSQLPASIYVPRGYREDNPAGIIIYLSGGYPNNEYKKSIDSHNLIWAGVNCKKFTLDDILMDKNPHEIYTLAVAYFLMRHYAVDPGRVYLAGFSWGGRLAGRILTRFPRIFSGGISTGGSQIITGDERYEDGFNDQFMYARENLTYIITAGDTDMNRDEGYFVADLLRRQMFRHVYYILEANRGHAPVSGINFENSLNLLSRPGH